MQVYGSRERAHQQSFPPLVSEAMSYLVAVVEHEAERAQQAAAGCPYALHAAVAVDHSLPMLCSISEPASPSGSVPAQLSRDVALWLPSTAAAALQYLESQVPGLLQGDVSDFLLDAICCMR